MAVARSLQACALLGLARLGAASWSPSGFVEKKAMSAPCAVFGNSYSLQHVMIKHTFIEHGIRCAGIDVDKYPGAHSSDIEMAIKLIASVNPNLATTDLPMVFVNGNPIGGFDSVLALLGKKSNTLTHAKTVGMFAKSGATMLSCKEQLAYHGPAVKAAAVEPATDTVDETSYVKKILASHPCVVFANTWCANDEKDSISGACKPYSADLENGLMEMGAQCHVVDLLKNRMNKGFFRILSTEAMQMKDFSYMQARFGSQLPLDAEKEIVLSKPVTACKPLKNANELRYGGIALVERGHCTFETKARHLQAAGASGMVLMNNDDRLLTMKDDGKKGHASAIKIWAIAVKESAGLTLSQAIKNAPNGDKAVTISIERGGNAEKALATISGGQIQLPAVFVQGKKIADLGDLKGYNADAINDNTFNTFLYGLKKQLVKAGAFMRSPSCSASSVAVGGVRHQEQH